MGFKSGEYGGHCCEEMKLGTFSCKKKNVGFHELYGMLPSLVETSKWFLPSCLRVQGNKALFKIFSQYMVTLQAPTPVYMYNISILKIEIGTNRVDVF